jgi:FkbM family methyltransferase
VKEKVKALLKDFLPAGIYNKVFRLYLRVKQKEKYQTKLVRYKNFLVNAYVDTFTGRYLVENDCTYERKVTRILEAALHDGMIAIDVGANMGLHTLTMSESVGSKGMVYAFEPTSDNLKKLNTNLAINGIKNVKVCPFAVGNKNDVVEFYRLPGDFCDGSSSLVVNEYLDSKKSKLQKEKVKSVTLDEYFKDFDRKINLIKMDIEGFEYYALLGMENIKINHAPLLIIEYSLERMKFIGISNEHMKEVLEDTYDCYQIMETGLDDKYHLDPFYFDRDVLTYMLCVPRFCPTQQDEGSRKLS